MYYSLCSITDSPPPSVRTVVSLNEAGKVKITWSRPSVVTGRMITGYSVQYRKRGYLYRTVSVPGSGTTSYTIINLSLGAIYDVRVAFVGTRSSSGYCCGSGIQVITYNCECDKEAVIHSPYSIVLYSYKAIS